MNRNKKNEQENRDIELINLKTTNNNYELSTIESILKDNAIPYILHDYESGAYMRIYAGASLFGTDIMVNKSDFEKAKELIEGIL